MVATQSQSFSITRRTLDVEDYVDITRRHMAWILGPAFFGLVASICVAFVLPNTYTSRATMQITPAQVSESMVQSTISNSLNQRIQQMETSILSHTGLSVIIQDPRLNLYKEELKTTPLEDVIEEMKHNIHIDFVTLPGALGRQASAFDITFNYNDRYKAQQVVQALMNKFDEENQITQKTDEDAVKGLVGDMLQTAKATLTDADDKLTAFKEANAGKLPENVGLNIARENGYTEKIKSVGDQIFRDQQALATLETQKSQVQGQIDFFDQQQAAVLAAMAANGTTGANENKDLAALDATIDNLEFQLQTLRRSYSEKYPPIKDRQIQLDSYKARRADFVKRLQAKAEADAKAAADADQAKKSAPTTASIREAEERHKVDAQLQQIAAQEKLLNDDIDKLKTEQENDKKQSEDVNQLLKDSTGIEAEYQELRDTKTMAENNYLDDEKKQQLADANSQLIQRKESENLDVLDVASLPMEPTSPKRYMIVGAGFAMSLVLGLGLAGIQEAKDTSLKNLKDVRAYTNLPVLCSIPLLENTMLVKRKKRLTYLAWTAAVIVGAVAVSGAVVYYETITMRSIG